MGEQKKKDSGRRSFAGKLFVTDEESRAIREKAIEKFSITDLLSPGISENPEFAELMGKYQSAKAHENWERQHEQKHLRAYLKGEKRFQHGFDYDTNGLRHPAYYPVQEVWK